MDLELKKIEKKKEGLEQQVRKLLAWAKKQEGKESKEATVQEKIKNKQKLTTEDLLVFQKSKGN